MALRNRASLTPLGISRSLGVFDQNREKSILGLKSRRLWAIRAFHKTVVYEKKFLAAAMHSRTPDP
jgi:hypothetical protein